MTIGIEKSYELFDCDGENKRFSFTFKVFDGDDVKVYLVSAVGKTLLDKGHDYYIEGFDFLDGGTVVTTEAYSNAFQIEVAREPDLKQKTSFRNLGKFYPDEHENAFDRIYMILQTYDPYIRNSISADTSGIWDFQGKQSKNVPSPLKSDSVANAAYVMEQIKNAQSESVHVSPLYWEGLIEEGVSRYYISGADVPDAKSYRVILNDKPLRPNKDYEIVIDENTTDSEILFLVPGLQTGDRWWVVGISSAFVTGDVPFMRYEVTIETSTRIIAPAIKFNDAVIFIDGAHKARKTWELDKENNQIILGEFVHPGSVVTALLNLRSDAMIDNQLNIRGRDRLDNIIARTGAPGDIWISSSAGVLVNPNGEQSNVNPDDGIAWSYNTNYPDGWIYIGKIGVGTKGDKGEDGSTPFVGGNGNWWVDGVDTGVSAGGVGLGVEQPKKLEKFDAIQSDQPALITTFDASAITNNLYYQVIDNSYLKVFGSLSISTPQVGDIAIASSSPFPIHSEYGMIAHLSNSGDLTPQHVTEDASKLTISVTASHNGIALDSMIVLSSPLSPVVEIQPQSKKIIEDSSYEITATFDGKGVPLTWQWFANDIASTAGTGELASNTVTHSQGEYQYYCTARNTIGKSVTTDTVTITAIGHPVVTSQPVAIMAGLNESFTVTAAVNKKNADSIAWTYSIDSQIEETGDTVNASFTDDSYQVGSYNSYFRFENELGDFVVSDNATISVKGSILTVGSKTEGQVIYSGYKLNDYGSSSVPFPLDHNVIELSVAKSTSGNVLNVSFSCDIPIDFTFDLNWKIGELNDVIVNIPSPADPELISDKYVYSASYDKSQESSFPGLSALIDAISALNDDDRIDSYIEIYAPEINEMTLTVGKDPSAYQFGCKSGAGGYGSLENAVVEGATIVDFYWEWGFEGPGTMSFFIMLFDQETTMNDKLVLWKDNGVWKKVKFPSNNSSPGFNPGYVLVTYTDTIPNFSEFAAFMASKQAGDTVTVSVVFA